MENSIKEACREKFLKHVKENNITLEDNHTFENSSRLLDGIVLNGSENVESVASIMTASIGLNRRNGLMVATNDRVFLLFKKGLGGSEINTFYYNRISSIGCKSTMTLSDVMIYTDGEKEQTFNTRKPEIVSAILQNLLNNYKNKSNQQVVIQQVVGSTNEEDIVSKLERVFNLKRDGAISDEEYEIMKKKIINS
jgi:hypothetical protein